MLRIYTSTNNLTKSFPNRYCTTNGYNNNINNVNNKTDINKLFIKYRKTCNKLEETTQDLYLSRSILHKYWKKEPLDKNDIIIGMEQLKKHNDYKIELHGEKIKNQLDKVNTLKNKIEEVKKYGGLPSSSLKMRYHREFNLYQKYNEIDIQNL